MAESRLAEIVRANETEILSSWMSSQLQSLATRRDLLSEADLHRESRDFLSALSPATTGREFLLHLQSWFFDVLEGHIADRICQRQKHE